MKVVMSAT